MAREKALDPRQFLSKMSMQRLQDLSNHAVMAVELCISAV